MTTLAEAASYVVGLVRGPRRPHYVDSPRRALKPTTAASPDLQVQVRHLCNALPSLWSGIRAALRPGNTTQQVESDLVDRIDHAGLTSAFRGYRAYSHDATISVNEEVINTVPSGRVLRAGDLVKIQFGLRHNLEAFAYQSWSFAVASSLPHTSHLLTAGHTALVSAVAAAQPGGRIGSISAAINESLYSNRLWPSTQYQGHGIGAALHAEPPVPCYAPRNILGTPEIAPGTLLSIVVLAHAAPPVTLRAADGWNVLAFARHASVLFSHMVLITETGPELLTGEVTKSTEVA